MTLTTIHHISRRMLALMALLLMALQMSGAQTAKESTNSFVRRYAGSTPRQLMHIANGESKRRNYQNAVQLYLLICNKYYSQPNLDNDTRRTCAVAFLQVGNIFFERGNYAGALSMYVKGLKMSKDATDTDIIPLLYNNVGNVYCAFKDYERGINYYLTGYKYGRSHDISRKDMYNLLANLTSMEMMLGHLKKAQAYFNASLKYTDKHDVYCRFSDQYNKVLILQGQKSYGRAVAEGRKLLALVTQNRLDAQYKGFATELLYKAYHAKGNIDSTRYYLNECLETAERHHLQHFFLDAYKANATIYQQQGQAKKAEQCREAYYTLLDSIYNQREFNAAKNEQFTYETQQFDKELFDMQAKESRHKAEIRFLLVVVCLSALCLLLVSLMLYIVYHNKQALKQSNIHLYKINKRLNETQENYQSQHISDQGTIKQLRAQLLAAEDSPAPVSTALEGNQNGNNSKAQPAKYTKSNLGQEQKQRLAAQILYIMEQTMEYCKPDFSLDQLASLVESNTTYVSQVINNEFHKNFTLFVNEYRIHQACKKLEDEETYRNYTIKSIGTSVGFRSASNFIETFKKLTGMTPTCYHNMAKSKDL